VPSDTIEPPTQRADSLNDLMDEHREDKMADLKEKVARGQYRVDPQAVADAILRRAHAAAAKRALGELRRRPPMHA
jgi:anti-sigma28 factor (negative regulator of flagellin synthesis)